MPFYTIDIIGVTGTSFGTFTSLGVVGQITYFDEDTLGVGDNLPDTETGALPTITAVTGTLPASWVGSTLAFGWQQQIDGSGSPDAIGMFISGFGFTASHLVQHPDGTPIVTGQTYTASSIENVPAEILICFAEGTRIKTKHGETPIEHLDVGDQVLTLDHGFQKIRWIGSTTRLAQGDHAPILFKAGSIGNSRDLRVSQQHRMLVNGWDVELMFGVNEAFVPAKALINDQSIRPDPGGAVTYYHILFDRHEVIYAEGARSESFHPGQQGWNSFDTATRAEILELFPDLEDSRFESYGASARETLKTNEATMLSLQIAC